jgi:hypothetical protein
MNGTDIFSATNAEIPCEKLYSSQKIQVERMERTVGGLRPSCGYTSPKSVHMRLVHSGGSLGLFLRDDVLDYGGNRWLIIEV